MNGLLSWFGAPALEWMLCLGTLVCVYTFDKESKFRPLAFLLATRAGITLLLAPILLMAGHAMDARLAYRIYFYGYWFAFSIEAVLSLFIIKTLFDLAMAPLEGIRELGQVVFRWAAFVSLAVTAAVMFVPHPSGIAYVTRILTELQRAQGVLTLSLLLFVSVALRPLGLTYRSRPFGVILGLGVLATSNLVSSGWLAYSTHVYSFIGDIRGIATSIALLLWMAYFTVREPKRSIVVLPTTSPYLHWNQVAQVLGDPPGFVAIAGVPPELFSSAELEVMRRASLKMTPLPFPLLDHSNIA